MVKENKVVEIVAQLIPSLEVTKFTTVTWFEIAVVLEFDLTF